MIGIFVWQVHPGLEDEFAFRWQHHSMQFQRCEGAQGTKLHRNDGSRFMECASWRSIDDHRRADEELRKKYPQCYGNGRYSTEVVSDLVFVVFFNDPEVIIEPGTGLIIHPNRRAATIGTKE